MNYEASIMSANTSARVQKHRNTLRDAGLRPVQIWVPDTRRAGFAEECRRQSRALLHDVNETDTLAWLEQIADRSDWK
jgi:Protein  of unknown function (DUF3018)